MRRKSPKRIICITGMPGAGKSTVAEVASGLGFEIVNMGDAIREEAQRRNVPRDDSHIGAIMLELRRERGPGVVAELCLPKIEKSKKDRFVVDGVRSMDEVKVFRTVAQTKIIAVSAPMELRKQFLRERGREDAPSFDGSFENRDEREVQVGVRDVMAAADENLENHGISIEELRRRAEMAIRRMDRGDEAGRPE